MYSVISIYAPVFALFYVFLSLNVIKTRRRERVGLGSAGNKAVERAMRVHANFSEYVPITLLLLLVLEQVGSSAVLLHALFALLLAGRVVHAWGVSQQHEDFRFRVTGMVMTFFVIITSSLAILALRVFSMSG